MSQSPDNSHETQYVYYHEGGVPGKRPILTGSAAKPTFTELPRIDISRAYSSDAQDRRQLAAEVNDAFTNVGFFYAVNHGVEPEIVEDIFAAMRRYFALPEDVKMEAHSRQNHKFRGYEPMFSTRLDPTTRGDLKEGFLMGEDALDPEQGAPPSVIERQKAEGPRNQWPSLPGAAFWRPAVYRYHQALRSLSERLLRIFSCKSSITFLGA